MERRDLVGTLLGGRRAEESLPTHQGQPVDARALNAPALAGLPSLLRERHEVDCLIVPGFTPRRGRISPGRLHPKAADRCATAAADLVRGVAPVAIVTGGVVRGADNEAMLMREALLDLGIERDRILVEPRAQHTTTNLRNAARIMFDAGLRSAYVVTSDASYRSRIHWVAHRFFEQAYYLGFPNLSTFNWRCRRELGYTVGELAWVRPGHVYFVPSHACANH